MIYSGRTDPQWVVSEDEADSLIKLWSSLPLSGKKLILPAILGYKGCYLSSSTKMKWISFREVVTCYKSGKIAESRSDPDRIFERKILDTAPADVIPKAMLIEEFS